MSLREYIKNQNLLKYTNSIVTVKLEKGEFILKQFFLWTLQSTHKGQYDMKNEKILSVQVS